MKNILVVNKIKELNFLLKELKNHYIEYIDVNDIKKIEKDKYDIIFLNTNNHNIIQEIDIKQHLFLFTNNKCDIDCNYDLLLNKKATINILFNKNIDIITKEKSIIKFNTQKEILPFIKQIINDKYFKTTLVNDNKINKNEKDLFFYLIKSNYNNFNNVGKYLFGSVAIKTSFGFITTIRGKNELSDYSEIYSVDFEKRVVYSNKKASLNTPLLSYLFDNNSNIKYIVHHHNINPLFPSLKYASPGTLNDSIRDINKSFNIEFHGCFELYDYNNNLII